MTGILTLDDVLILSGSIDPSSVGYAAPIGSHFTHTGDGRKWQKTGAGNTDWALAPTATLGTSVFPVSVIPQTSITSVGTITTGVWNGSVITVPYGGTNITTYTTGDILYASATNVLSKRAIGKSNQILTISGGIPVWSTVNSSILGSVDNHSDVDTSTTVPTTGDSLVYNGSNWVPSSATSVGTNNYVFAFDTTTQPIASANTWQDVTYDTNGEISDWTHTTGTANFTCSASGLYAATVEFNTQKTGGGNVESAMRCLFNGIYLPGSHQGQIITANTTPTPLSRTFLFDAVVSQIFKIQFAGSSTTARISPAPTASAGGVTAVSTSITIRRLT